LQGDAGTTEQPEVLSPYSQRILWLLNQAVDRIERGYSEYVFTEIAQAIYEFFWSDFCDWYLEAAKQDLQVPGQERDSVLWVIDYVFGVVLRLLHPFMPHITAELWSRSGRVGDIQFAPVDDLRFEGALDAAAVEYAALVYQAVAQARNLRAEYRIASNRKARMILAAKEPGDITVLARLANAEPLEIAPEYVAPQGVPVVVTPLGPLYLSLEGLIDVEAENERLQREITKLQQDLAAVRQKLANENFVNRAPVTVVEEHRERAKKFEERLEQLQARLSPAV
jgi:valyl-tRNA synthetase